MSEEEKALILIRMVEECKTARSDLVSLRAKARNIGVGLTHIGGVLSNSLPEHNVIAEHAATLVTPEEILALVDEIRSKFDRVTFLEKELSTAGIRVAESD